jgi:mono/diheme cytochrome c family protein
LKKGKGIMKATGYRFKKVTFAFAAFALLAFFLLSPVSIRTSASSANGDDFDAAGVFKAKCAMCHGPKAEKKFDATIPEDQMQAAILTGKKAEKPPNMPEFQSKGITAEQATALIAYMKSLKQ